MLTHNIHLYCSSPCFSPSSPYLGTPWHRPIAIDSTGLDFETPLTEADLGSPRALLIQQILFNIYEQSMLFLPKTSLGKNELDAFQTFYSDELVTLGESIRPQLEKLSFDWLNQKIEITGRWKDVALKDYFKTAIDHHESRPSDVCEQISQSRDPLGSYQAMLIQQASDALSEASGMSRYMSGNYGTMQSELAKVFIDEYGYGVASEKHSTLFENLLTSVGLKSNPHEYFSQYNATSLLQTNYFHYISMHKRFWFRYLGAIYFAEASLPHLNKQMYHLTKKLFPQADNKYYAEHMEIDLYHREMMLNKIILPAVALFGEKVIPDIVAGFESYRYLSDLPVIDWSEFMWKQAV